MLAIKSPERRQRHRSGILIQVNILHLTLNPAFSSYRQLTLVKVSFKTCYK